MVVGCSNEPRPPKGLIGKEQMVAFLVDLHIAEVKVQNLGIKVDSVKKVFSILEADLFRQHQFNDSLYIKSYQFYVEQPSLMEEIYSAVLDTLSLRRDLVEAAEKKRNLSIE